jgi:5-hydroxyisourate hydrolase
MGISTHILDLTVGRPAAGVKVTLEMHAGGPRHEFSPVGHGITNADGRIPHLIEPTVSPIAGVYRLTFEVAPYFEQQGKEAFYPEVQITFMVRNPAEHHHVPLLLNPFGYSTYRGS